MDKIKLIASPLMILNEVGEAATQYLYITLAVNFILAELAHLVISVIFHVVQLSPNKWVSPLNRGCSPCLKAQFVSFQDSSISLTLPLLTSCLVDPGDGGRSIFRSGSDWEKTEFISYSD